MNNTKMLVTNNTNPRPGFQVGSMLVTHLIDREPVGRQREFFALAQMDERHFFAIEKGRRVYDVFRWSGWSASWSDDDEDENDDEKFYSWAIADRRNPIIVSPVVLDFDLEAIKRFRDDN